MSRTSMFLALVGAVAVSAVASAETPAAPAPTTMPAMAADRPAVMTVAERMGRDIQGAASKGDMERDLVDVMVFHHQGAIQMAGLYLGFGRDPTLRKLMQQMIVDRQREIAEFQAWLAEHPANDRWLAKQAVPAQ